MSNEELGEAEQGRDVEPDELVRGFEIDARTGAILSTVRCMRSAWSVWAVPAGAFLVQCEDESITEVTHVWNGESFSTVGSHEQ